MSSNSSVISPYLVHIVSIIAIAAVVLGVDGLFFYFDHVLDDVSLLWWSFFNIAGVTGMSYYLANVTVNATGFNETTTTPATPQ